jgi:hypothetical protein
VIRDILFPFLGFQQVVLVSLPAVVEEVEAEVLYFLSASFS